MSKRDVNIFSVCVSSLVRVNNLLSSHQFNIYQLISAGNTHRASSVCVFGLRCSTEPCPPAMDGVVVIVSVSGSVWGTFGSLCVCVCVLVGLFCRTLGCVWVGQGERKTSNVVLRV